MNEKDLNVEYICEKTLLNKDDELVPIILDLVQKSYRAGLCQAEFDNTMNLIEENQELKSQLVGTTHCFDEEEHRELKKQLEAYETYFNRFFKLNNKTYDGKIILKLLDKKETQQKEFIKYLEDEIKELQKIKETESDYDILKDVIPQLLVCKDVLQKYKSTIGGKE